MNKIHSLPRWNSQVNGVEDRETGSDNTLQYNKSYPGCVNTEA